MTCYLYADGDPVGKVDADGCNAEYDWAAYGGFFAFCAVVNAVYGVKIAEAGRAAEAIGWAFRMDTNDVYLYLMLSLSCAAIGIVLLITTALLTNYFLERQSGQAIPPTQIVSICKQNVCGFLLEWFVWITFIIPIILLLLNIFNFKMNTRNTIILITTLYIFSFYGGKVFEAVKYHRKRRLKQPGGHNEI